MNMANALRSAPGEVRVARRAPSGAASTLVSATTPAVAHTTCEAAAYTTRPASADSPITASEVPCARCWLSPKPPVRIGTIRTPPPTPNRPPATPATRPARRQPQRPRPVIASLLSRGLGDRGVLDETLHVGEAGGRGRGAEYDGDQIAALGVDPGGETITSLVDESRLPGTDVHVAMEQPIRVRDRVQVRVAAELGAELVALGGHDGSHGVIRGGGAQQACAVGRGRDVALIEAGELHETRALQAQLHRLAVHGGEEVFLGQPGLTGQHARGDVVRAHQ